MLGAGFMGEVYECVDSRTGARGALKILKPSQNSSEEYVGRFFREAKAASAAANSHIIKITDVGHDRKLSIYFIVMELLEGHNLYDELEKFGGKLGPAHALEIILQVLAGLRAAHKANVIHRDLKPENTFVGRDDMRPTLKVTLLDFGIAQFEAEGARMTNTSTVMGTPYYMSEEQARTPRQVDARTDIYSVGVMLYELLTGNVPFNGDGAIAILMSAARDPIPPMRDIDPQLAKIVSTAMARKADDRFATAEAFYRALEAYARKQRFLPVGAQEFPLPEHPALTAPPEEPTEVVDLVPLTAASAAEGAILTHQSGTLAGVGEKTLKPPPPIDVKLQQVGGDAGQPPSQPVPTPPRQAETSMSGTFDKRVPVRRPSRTTGIIIAFAVVVLAAIGALIMRGVANTPHPTPHTTRDARPEPTPVEPSTPAPPTPTPPPTDPATPVVAAPQEPPAEVTPPSGRNRRTPRGQPRPPHSRRHRCHPDPDDPDGPQICD
jgi:serine/threonine-protein kinase